MISGLRMPRLIEHFKFILRRTQAFQNFLLWQCQLQCKQNYQKPVHCHTHAELFCEISFHGKRTQCPIAIVFFCSFGLNFICCLHLLGYHWIKYVSAFLSIQPSHAGSFPLKLYFYEEFLIMKGATASLRNCGHIICKKYQSTVIFRKWPFQNLAVDNVVFCTKSPILIKSLFHHDVKSSQQLQLNSFSPQRFRKHIYNTTIFDRQRSPDIVAQLILSASIL